MRSDEFLKNVTEVGGPSDAESAAVVTRTVLDNLGKQLKGGEAADLAAQLPAELQEPLQRHGSEAPLTDDVDDFLRRLAEQLGEGIDPDTARAYAGAVLSTVDAAVSEGEIGDLRSQLPAGFAPLFED
ncbi:MULTISPECIES: DUF2267 domain-containing protein [unclassified Brevibacterium]|jgi:uncharacterized protein (DUF2267 family)|uniref:DUF2267 domain-containing protein n=1 Tax=unclassified Brevibacterium TaxID=2614124 RepID=UPI001BA9B59D|nr:MULTISPECIES: DUF2267 domain-containing protein [unclassified Brevibacterium]QUL79620.1 DUF2267 domain-containing protein [Brevibacterium sp. SMBL_HHYL_HB1]